LSKDYPPYDPETVVLGAVGRPHGLHGELWVRPYNAGGDALDGVDSVVLDRDGKRTPYEIEAARGAGEGVLVKLAGVDDRDAAAALTLSLVRVARADLPPLEPGEYYVEDVVGCAVVRDDGTPLGSAVGTFWNGAHDVMTVVDAAGSERLIPLVPDFVLAVDGPGRKIQVSWEDE
jgi:16S rRNA processing protein RimM